MLEALRNPTLMTASFRYMSRKETDSATKQVTVESDQHDQIASDLEVDQSNFAPEVLQPGLEVCKIDDYESIF